MAVQVVTSMAIITAATTPCSSGATITQRRVSSSCSSVPSRMVVGLEIGSKRRIGSLSLCNPQIRSAGILNSSEILREKCSLALGNTVCRQAVQALSDTESAEGHVTIVEDCEYLNKIFLWFWTLSLFPQLFAYFGPCFSIVMREPNLWVLSCCSSFFSFIKVCSLELTSCITILAVHISLAQLVLKANLYTIQNPNLLLSLETAETFDRLLEEAGERLVYLFYL